MAASAEVCDSLTLGDAAQEVLVGEWGTVGNFAGREFWVADSQNLMGICWRDQGGAWHAERLECGALTSSEDEFQLDVGAGDDYVSTILPEHTVGFTGNSDFVFAGGYTGFEVPDFPGPHSNSAFLCDGVAIAPWSREFDFSMRVDMGEGADTYHGGPARDRVASNFAEFVLTWVGFPQGFQAEFQAPADHSLDMLCGGDGNDQLYGDLDNDYLAGEEELLDGQRGNDTCDGDPNPLLDAVQPPGEDQSDVTPSSCETRDDAWFNDSHFACESTANAFFTLAL